MTITFDRSLCCDLNETITREWLVTNGLGGYAAGTVAGVLTRKHHGLLVAKWAQATRPQLLLAKLDEEVFFDQRTYYLGTNEYQNGALSPAGFVHLESFRLENGLPIFLYHLGGCDGILLEKRIWMERGCNTTYIQYRVLRTTRTEDSGKRRSGLTGALSADLAHTANSTRLTSNTPGSIELTLLPFTAYRPYDQLQYGHSDQQFQVQTHQRFDRGGHLPAGSAGCTITAHKDAQPFHLLIIGQTQSQATFIPTGVWYWHVLHRQDAVYDQPAQEDLYLPGVMRATLHIGDETPLTIVVSSEKLNSALYQSDYIQLSAQEREEYQQQLLPDDEIEQQLCPLTANAHPPNHPDSLHMNDRDYLYALLEAADHFFVYDALSEHKHTSAITSPRAQLPHQPPIQLLTTYYSREIQTREALIALPGLLLVGRRTIEARLLLRFYAHYFLRGLLPERLPDREHPLTEKDYQNVDIALWYFYALDFYLQATQDDDFLEEMFPYLQECIQCYLQGSSDGISIDPADGLLVAHRPGVALTWMNAYRANQERQPVTPRSGKAVEVNALWYHALSLMYEWSQCLRQRGHMHTHPKHYQLQLQRCKKSFQQRFWYAKEGYLYDVIDGPQGDDPGLRPNQLFAFSLRHPLLELERRQSVIDCVNRYLITPYGLRTLAPTDPCYQPHWETGSDGQQKALHQGSIWSWLIGAYIDSQLSLHPSGSQNLALEETIWRKGYKPLQECFAHGLLNMSKGIFEGETPSSTTNKSNQISIASIGELLRVYSTLNRLRTYNSERAYSY
ncbi:amylo-alpha-1,6-glucosidase [Tengunoibacter tsumagoiensis]|uniref:Glycogen debranching protein n=1 Tax=Tengunoibacter tsumagoiensis TaxID=2014871 RepID=A0A401ZUW6_9CHLR|nr:amylo-alpha-1,6-glucosidase [Tengunoibacter tsumagoiensis]GCE10715.1 hypothetical protein KTT_05740 [Tengunoibacter tsumagoiensis]